MDIKAAQKEGLFRLLNLNQDIDPFEEDVKTDSSSTWKVLIYDKACQDILSPVISVGDLRGMGITLNMLINSPRDRVPDVPAIYFLTPTSENMDLVAKDCETGIYDSLYLNFSTSIPRNLLEDLALRTLQANAVSRIHKVVDQYINFVSLENQLFSLNIRDSYAQLSGTQDSEIEKCIDDIATGLFSVLATLSVVPIIVCQPEQAAEMVARKLNAKIRDHLRSQGNMFADKSISSFHRPMLLLVDRNIDLPIVLQHTWTYKALAHDVLGMKSNRVVIDAEIDGTVQRKNYILDDTDEFWIENAAKAFQDVADKVAAFSSDYQQQVAAIGAASESDAGALHSATTNLASTIDRLPQLQRRKRLVDAHTNIATAMMKQVSGRGIDSLFLLEERMTASGLFPDRAALLQALSPNSKGTPEDKMRLLLVYYLSKDEVDAGFLAELQSVAQESGCSLQALDHLRKDRMLHRVATGQHDTADVSALFKANSALDRGMGWLKGNVKNLLPLKHKAPLTKVVRDLVQGTRIKGYKYFDPRGASVPANAMSTDILCMVCGGGSYVEMDNILDWAKDATTSTPVRVIYGATEMVSPEDMLRQLHSLAEPSGPNGLSTDLT